MGSQRVRHDLQTKGQQETVTQGLLYIFSNIPNEVIGLHAHINNIPDYRNLSAMQETWVQFLGREEPLEKEMATHSSILAWRIPWTEEPGRLQSMGSQESDTT